MPAMQATAAERSPWTILGLAVGVQFGVSLVDQGVLTLTGFIKLDFGLSAFSAGLVVASFALGRIIGAYAAGVAADRLGEQRTLLVGGLATAGTVLMASLMPLPVFVPLMVMAGAAGASATPAGGRLVLLAFPRNRHGVALGIRQTGIPVGGLVAAATLPWIAHVASWMLVPGAHEAGPLAGLYALDAAAIAIALAAGVATIARLRQLSRASSTDHHVDRARFLALSGLGLSGVSVVLLIGLGGAMKGRRRTHLKDRFGSEYDRTVDDADNRRRAERELREREARHDSTELLVRYASGIDRRDWALFRTCWTDDCRADYGDIGTWEGVDALTDWMSAALSQFDMREIFPRGKVCRNLSAMLSPTVRTLGSQPFLFGAAPTLADAALYGQFAMLHAADPALLARFSPTITAWITRLERQMPRRPRSSLAA